MNFNNIYIVLLSFLPFINASGILLGPKVYEANPDAKRLYDDLLSNYNRLIRPVVNNTETLTVWLGLKLSQLIEMNLKNQVMTTNVWVEQKWFDYKLQWDPMEYGGVEMLYVPSENIWLPDIVLYNKSPTTHKMSKWVRKLFLHWMPRLLMMRRTPYATPEYTDMYIETGYSNDYDYSYGDNESEYTTDMKENPDEMDRVTLGYKNMEDEDGHPHGSSHDSDNMLLKHLSPDVMSALKGYFTVLKQ
ncbi:hypothetical protein G9C98_007113 [Cotesia typhae]|uniref:Neurotransmitter-gated ion-channel ligand-binding domain-containing protein n=1 Tax=Cotesia typhae TaxID=2053667 RepID=A0A8J5VDB6_9HYME|nr:hypothetical protein G9C98_007113 [Cotesia typhae]